MYFIIRTKAVCSIETLEKAKETTFCVNLNTKSHEINEEEM